MDRTGSKQERRSPTSKERNVRCVGNWRDFEARNCVEVLSRNVRSKLHVSTAAFSPILNHLLDRFDITHQSQHQLSLSMRRDDVGFGSATNSPNVGRRGAKNWILGEVEI